MSDIKISKVDTEGKEEYIVGYNPYTSDYQELTLDTAGTMLDRPIRVGVNVSQYLTHEKWTIEEGDSEAFGEGVIVFRFPRNVSDIGAFIIYAAGELMDGASMYEKIFAVLGDSSGVYKWCSDEGFYARITDSSIYATPISDNRVAVYGTGFNNQVRYHMICICGNTGSLAFHTASAELASRASSITLDRPDGFREWLWFCSLWDGPITETHEIGCAIYREGRDTARTNADLEFYRTDTELFDLHDRNITLSKDAINNTITITCLGTGQFAAGVYNFFWLGQEDVQGYVHYTDDASLSSEDMLPGQKGYAKGQLVEGSMSIMAGRSYYPSTEDQTVEGCTYLGGNLIIRGDRNLVPENIRAGASVFGVYGECGDWKIKELFEDEPFSGGIGFDDGGTTGKIGAWFLYPARDADTGNLPAGTVVAACGDGYHTHALYIDSNGRLSGFYGDAPILVSRDENLVEVTFTSATINGEYVAYKLRIVYGGCGCLKFREAFDDTGGSFTFNPDSNPLAFMVLSSDTGSQVAQNGTLGAVIREFEKGWDRYALVTPPSGSDTMPGIDGDRYATTVYDDDDKEAIITIPSGGGMIGSGNIFYFAYDQLHKTPWHVVDAVSTSTDLGPTFVLNEATSNVGAFAMVADGSMQQVDHGVYAIVHDGLGTTIYYLVDNGDGYEFAKLDTTDVMRILRFENTTLVGVELPDGYTWGASQYRACVAYGGVGALEFRLGTPVTLQADANNVSFPNIVSPAMWVVAALNQPGERSNAEVMFVVGAREYTGRNEGLSHGGTGSERLTASTGFNDSAFNNSFKVSTQTTNPAVFGSGIQYGLYYLTPEDIEG